MTRDIQKNEHRTEIMEKECSTYETKIGEKGNKYNDFIKNKVIMSMVWEKIQS